MQTYGWAVVQDGKINMKTVYSTRRGAIANWLLVGCGLMFGDNVSDEQIEEMWKRRSAGDKSQQEAEVREITVDLA